MGLLAILFVIGAIVMSAIIFFGMLDAEVMPLACPRCHADSREVGGTLLHWYSVRAQGSVQCRTCQTRFKEHPNGALVEDRD